MAYSFRNWGSFPVHLRATGVIACLAGAGVLLFQPPTGMASERNAGRPAERASRPESVRWHTERQLPEARGLSRTAPLTFERHHLSTTTPAFARELAYLQGKEALALYRGLSGVYYRLTLSSKPTGTKAHRTLLRIAREKLAEAVGLGAWSVGQAEDQAGLRGSKNLLAQATIASVEETSAALARTPEASNSRKGGKAKRPIRKAREELLRLQELHQQHPTLLAPWATFLETEKSDPGNTPASREDVLKAISATLARMERAPEPDR